ncbi:MAG: DsrE family protein [Ignavibacteriales bacterium]|nr:DsrE family protein [Ignavibacteriales bacterium]
MNILILVNDAPYGTEKMYNALRLAMTLGKEHQDVKVNLFLMADAVTGGIPNQVTPSGYYNIERMMRAAINYGTKVKACGSCADARGLKNLQMIEGVEISTMSELTKWTVEADKVITF